MTIKMGLDLSASVHNIGSRKTPELSQIIKPEIENLKNIRFSPKPHPPINRKMPKLSIKAGGVKSSCLFYN